jgi:hypothetical protein
MRGLMMVSGRPNYEYLANALERPDLLDTPDLLASDADLSARAVIAMYRRQGLLSQCAPESCILDHILRRTLGLVAADQIRDMVAAGVTELERSR